ncbi:MAG: hypothetical protein HYX94_01440 [Chloroflexi bacterium]|nr:hypothetical protein [Chloroflexota bacterium]
MPEPGTGENVAARDFQRIMDKRAVTKAAVDFLTRNRAKQVTDRMHAVVEPIIRGRGIRGVKPEETGAVLEALGIKGFTDRKEAQVVFDLLNGMGAVESGRNEDEEDWQSSNWGQQIGESVADVYGLSPDQFRTITDKLRSQLQLQETQE